MKILQPVCCQGISYFDVLNNRWPDLRDAETRLEEERNRFVTLEKEFQKFRVEKGALLQNEKQTVGLLVSEKASLISELQRLERIEFGE